MKSGWGTEDAGNLANKAGQGITATGTAFQMHRVGKGTAAAFQMTGM